METAHSNRWYDWYQSFDQNHSPEARQAWYSGAAKAYRWARPSYPNTLIEQVEQAIAQARLIQSGLTQSGLAQAELSQAEPASVLEIGCGPGIATAALATKGLSIIGIEPSPAACALARQACEAYPAVRIVNSTFEAYPLHEQTFDAVIAATSFHWIAPEVACEKSAAALKSTGALILLWATPPQPSPEICEALQPIYDRHGLNELGQDQCRTQAYYQANFEMFADAVNGHWFRQVGQDKVSIYIG
ncbi:MAG: SAM-dependent methyltransferase [Phormidesmis priestleyi]|uniref:SAM-dependent methyltransferase n=1 Tax=Phormidesmis priestleyi TaxID=268141 RepID=A0A2W4XK97_9CYAN|nr:MAG: SAM-dependent methyltransferase [Phormidesmis priestleyi]